MVLPRRFLLLLNFYLCTHVNVTRVNKIEAVYQRSCVNVEVEPHSTLTFTRGLLYIASNSFTHRRKIYVHVHVKIIQQWKSTLRINDVVTGYFA